MKQKLKKSLLPLIYAQRDLRSGIKGFYIFIICLVLGVSAIGSIQSLSYGLMESLHHDGRYILGGDIALRTIYKPATKEQQDFLKENIGSLSITTETRAMARRTDGQKTTLTELKAVDAFYPLYGTLRIIDKNNKNIQKPLKELLHIDKNKIWGAVLEQDILSRLHLKFGDKILIGQQVFQIRGIITKEPDRIGSTRFTLAPRVMITQDAFKKTDLKKKGSQVYYDHKILTPHIKNFDHLKTTREKITKQFPDAGWRIRDFLTASPRIERLINRLTLFLTLIGLSTLLIGGVGISSAMRSFLETKLADIATLKCLGARENFVFRTYLIQVLILATLGIFLATLASIFISQTAGAFLTEKLSLTNQTIIYPKALLLAAGFGYLTTLCFSLWPIGRAIKTSPANLFRDAITPKNTRPSFQIIIGIFISILLLSFLTILSASDQKLVFFFVLGTMITFIVFFIYAFLIKLFIKKLIRPKKPEMRLAMANLHRPGNISTSIILSLGIGLTVLISISLIQFNFTQLIQGDIAEDTPSFFFLDIEDEQRTPLKTFVSQEKLARNLIIMPSLRGRVIRVNGISSKDALVDKNEQWIIKSDRGITYTPKQPAYSKVIEGQWWPEDYTGKPLISIATNVARAFNIGVGDKITVHILGKDITATVSNVREINWASFTMNFAITFAPGTLDKFPSNYIATVVVDKEHEEKFQTDIANKFQNITSIRVKDALNAAQTIIKGIGQAVNISAAITLLAGILVLAGGISAARRRHLYDAIILKVLGATKKRILKTFLLEYAILGSMTVMIAAGIGTMAAYSIQRFIMKLEWAFSWQALLEVTSLALIITLTAGFLGTWRILNQKPAPYLRNQ